MVTANVKIIYNVLNGLLNALYILPHLTLTKCYEVCVNLILHMNKPKLMLDHLLEISNFTCMYVSHIHYNK